VERVNVKNKHQPTSKHGENFSCPQLTMFRQEISLRPISTTKTPQFDAGW